MRWITLIKSIGQFKEALEAGQQVSNPKTWKNASITANQIAFILTTIILGLKVIDVELPVTDEVIIIISGALAGLLQAANIILTIVTTKKLAGRDALKIESPVATVEVPK